MTVPLVGSSTRGSMERSFMIIFLVLRALYVLEAIDWIAVRYPVTTVGRHYARVMLVLLAVIAVESVVLGSRMYLRRSVLVGRWPVVLDLVVVAGALVAVSDHVMAPELRQPWGCVIYNVSLTSAVLVGTRMTSWRMAVRWGIYLACGFWSIGAVPFLAPWSRVALTGVDAGWFLTNFAIAAVIVVIGRDLGDAVDAAKDRVADLERGRSRARAKIFLPFLESEALAVVDEPTSVRRRRQLYRAMRAFVDGTASPPPERSPRRSLRGDVERKIMLAGGGLRGACLLAVALAAVAQGLNFSWPTPRALAGFTVVVSESLLVGIWTYRRGSLTVGHGPVMIDLITAVTALGVLLDPLASVSTSVWNLRVCTLVASAASFLGLAVRSLWSVAAGSMALSLAHVMVVAVSAWGRTPVVVSTIAYASCGYWICAVVAWLFARRLRVLAAEADTARRRIVQLERERSRAIVHDLLPYLGTERGSATSGLVPAAVMRLTRAKYRQVKAFADGIDGGEDLTSRLESLLEVHPRVALRPRLDLPPGTCLPTEVSSRVERAVDTALANAEQNAPGATVWVTAAIRAGDIVVTVRDDGPGFDPARTRPGYGVARILGDHLEEVGVRCAVTSCPGEGTEVTITVPGSCR